jgi:TM2 domain-containing membrane protein YozV/RNA polymerase subunit RPABC4/transcription elongation factor Spt4
MSDPQGHIEVIKEPASSSQVARQSDQKHCFSCGRVIHATSISCPSCGASQAAANGAASGSQVGHLAPANTIFCYGCGSQIHAAAPACPKCGAPHRAAMADRPGKEKTTAIVLAFLLGGIGAHKFYLGQIGLGILYLIFSWTFIPSVVAMIEGFIYLAKSEEEFAATYK